jgi:hypothetical protein
VSDLAEYLCGVLPGAWKSSPDRASIVVGDRLLIVRREESGTLMAAITWTGSDPLDCGPCPDVANDLPRIVANMVQNTIYRIPLRAADVPSWAHDRVRSSVTVPAYHREPRRRYDTFLSEINTLA